MTTTWRPRPVGVVRRTNEDSHIVVGPSDADLLGDHLWHGRVTPDVALTPAGRARDAVLACGVPTLLHTARAGQGPAQPPSPADGGTVCLLAAAWIHTGGRPPSRLDVTVPRPVRARFGPVRYRNVVLSDRDVVVVGGVRVTSPLTTACDLARDAVEQDVALDGDPEPDGSTDPGRGATAHAEAIGRLLAAGVDADAVRARLVAAHRSRARQARTWLDARVTGRRA